MTESSKYNRVIFGKKGIQKRFILSVRSSLNMSVSDLAIRLGVSRRTVSDWTNERITMSQSAVEKISKWTASSIPKYQIVDWRIHWQNAGKIGARVKLARYGNVGGDEKYRKEKWMEWWYHTGQYKKPPKGFVTKMRIRIPRKSKMLAEFIGILLGDGNISQYYVGITLSSDEKEYVQYVQSLIKKLFGVVPMIHKHRHSKAVSIIVNRKLLVDFCQKVGFQQGNKVTHQVDIPQWIKDNSTFSHECVRGLIDTDGCFFHHAYTVGSKKYSYLKIAFTSASAPLRLSVQEILIKSGFSVRMSQIRQGSRGSDIRIDGAKDVTKYIREIGTHNQKHLDKINKWRVAPNGKAAVC